MKKYLIMLAAIFCCAMTTTVFTACGDEKEEITPKQDEDNPQQQAEIMGLGGKYIISVTEQMAQLCDYTMTYYANDNQLTTEKATWTFSNGVATWEKNATSTSIPATFGIKVNVKVKDDAQLDGVRIANIYPVTKAIYLQGITTDAKMAWEKIVDFGAGVSTTAGTTGAKLSEYIAQWEKHGGVINKAYTFDKDGNQLSSSNIE